MSLLDLIFKKTGTRVPNGDFFKTFTAYSPVFHSFGGSIYESELVRASIDALARNTSKLKIEISGNPTIKKLEQRPNAFMTWPKFLYRLQTILLIHNTAFIVPIFDRYDRVIGIYPVLPESVEILDVHGVPWSRYRFGSGDTAAVELHRCGILTRHQYKSDYFGESNRALLPTMDLVNIDNQGIKEAVKNSATFRFMATMGNFGDPLKVKEERKNFSEMNMKADDEAGGILVFPNTWKDIKQIDSKPFTVNAKERELIQTNVFNYFGVNEDVLQNKATGDKWSAFYEGAIEPFAIQFSEELTNMLFTDREIAQGSSIMATANRLQYMTNAEKLAVSSAMADRGVMNRDEIREIWNLPPLPNGEGKAYIIRGEYWNAVEKVGDEGVEGNDPDQNAQSE